MGFDGNCVLLDWRKPLAGQTRLIDWLQKCAKLMPGEVHAEVMSVVSYHPTMDMDKFVEELDDGPTKKFCGMPRSLRLKLRRLAKEALEGETETGGSEYELSRVLEVIKDRAGARFRSVAQARKQLDTDGNDILSKDGLLHCLQCCNLGRPEMEQLWKVLKKDSKGFARASEVVGLIWNKIRGEMKCFGQECLDDLEPPQGGFCAPVVPTYHMKTLQDDMPANIRFTLRKFVEKAQLRFKNLRKMFLWMDTGRNGLVRVKALEDLFFISNLPVGDARALYEYMDPTGQGLTFGVFGNIMTPFMTEAEVQYPDATREARIATPRGMPEEVARAVEKVRAKMQARYRTVRACVNRLTFGKGIIQVTREEFASHIEMKLGLSRSYADIVYDYVDSSGSGAVYLEDVVGVLEHPPAFEGKHREATPRVMVDPELKEDLRKFLTKLTRDYSDVTMGLRVVTKDICSGETVTREEMLNWCAKHKIPQHAGEKLFELARIKKDVASYEKIVMLLARYIEWFLAPREDRAITDRYANKLADRYIDDLDLATNTSFGSHGSGGSGGSGGSYGSGGSRGGGSNDGFPRSLTPPRLPGAGTSPRLEHTRSPRALQGRDILESDYQRHSDSGSGGSLASWLQDARRGQPQYGAQRSPADRLDQASLESSSALSGSDRSYQKSSHSSSSGPHVPLFRGSGTGRTDMTLSLKSPHEATQRLQRTANHVNFANSRSLTPPGRSRHHQASERPHQASERPMTRSASARR